MKKYILLSVIFLVASSMLAEELTFVTTLSAPVGSFRQVDTNTQTQAGTVTFYKPNTKVTLRGITADFRDMKLGGGTLAGTEVTQFKSKYLRAADGGSISGRGLLATELKIDSPSKGVVGGTLYSNENLKAQRAKIDNLTINNETTITLSNGATPGTDTLKWCANELGTTALDKAKHIFLTDLCPDEKGKTCSVWNLEGKVNCDQWDLIYNWSNNYQVVRYTQIWNTCCKPRSYKLRSGKMLRIVQWISMQPQFREVAYFLADSFTSGTDSDLALNKCSGGGMSGGMSGGISSDALWDTMSCFTDKNITNPVWKGPGVKINWPIPDVNEPYSHAAAQGRADNLANADSFLIDIWPGGDKDTLCNQCETDSSKPFCQGKRNSTKFIDFGSGANNNWTNMISAQIACMTNSETACNYSNIGATYNLLGCDADKLDAYLGTTTSGFTSSLYASGCPSKKDELGHWNGHCDIESTDAGWATGDHGCKVAETITVGRLDYKTVYYCEEW